MAADQTTRILYRKYRLPEQLDRARRRVAMLEREAISLGMRDLVQGDASLHQAE